MKGGKGRGKEETRGKRRKLEEKGGKGSEKEGKEVIMKKETSDINSELKRFQR